MVSPGDRIRRAQFTRPGHLGINAKPQRFCGNISKEMSHEQCASRPTVPPPVHGVNDIAKCAQRLRELEDFNRAVMAAMQLKTYHEWRAAGRQVKLGERGHRVAPGLVGFTEDQTTAIDYSMGDNRDWDSDISDEEQLAGSDYFNDIGSR